MTQKTYKHTRITGESSESIEGAIMAAVATSEKAVEGHSWFEVVEIRGSLSGDAGIALYQVTLDVAFAVIESEME